jgi:hypothetical protein
MKHHKTLSYILFLILITGCVVVSNVEIPDHTYSHRVNGNFRDEKACKKDRRKR